MDRPLRQVPGRVRVGRHFREAVRHTDPGEWAGRMSHRCVHHVTPAALLREEAPEGSDAPIPGMHPAQGARGGIHQLLVDQPVPVGPVSREQCLPQGDGHRGRDAAQLSERSLGHEAAEDRELPGIQQGMQQIPIGPLPAHHQQAAGGGGSSRDQGRLHRARGHPTQAAWRFARRRARPAAPRDSAAKPVTAADGASGTEDGPGVTTAPAAIAVFTVFS